MSRCSPSEQKFDPEAVLQLACRAASQPAIPQRTAECGWEAEASGYYAGEQQPGAAPDFRASWIGGQGVSP